MNVISINQKLTAEDGLTGRMRPVKPPARRWGRFFAWVALVWAFIFVLAPWLKERLPAINTLANYVEESGIDAGAIYYTEVEEVGDADLAVRNTFRFYLPEERQKQ